MRNRKRDRVARTARASMAVRSRFPEDELAHDALARRVAAAGEPFRGYFDPEARRGAAIGGRPAASFAVCHSRITA